jgi:hypothetical protein
LARYNTDGTVDRSFDGDGIVITDFGEPDDRSVEGIFALAIQRNGKIVAAGVSLTWTSEWHGFRYRRRALPA